MSMIRSALNATDRTANGFRLDARQSLLLSERDDGGGPFDYPGTGTKGTGQNVLGGAGGGGPAFQSGRYSQSQAHHADQYGYFAGYPFAIIDNIANRLAAQPIRVGVILPKGRKPNRGRAIPRGKAWDHLGTDGWLCAKHLQEIANRVELIPNHKINRTLEHPNPLMVRHHLLYSTFASVEITGLAYWWMYKEEETGRGQIWPIPTHWMEPVHEEGKLFSYYKLSLPGSGQTIPVPAKQVARFLKPDPSDPFGAYPVMQAMAKTVMTDWAFEVAQRMSLENGINPGLAIMVGKPPEFAGLTGGDSIVLTQEQRNQIIGAVKRQYRGVTRFDEPLILDALIKDVKKITTSPQEMAFKDSGPLVRNRLSQGWSMNPITMGEIEGVNYASSGVADHHVCRTVFTPRVEVNSQTMTRFVGPYFGGQSVSDERVEGDLVVYQEPVQPSDPEMENNRDKDDLAACVIDRNDLRRKRGLPLLKRWGGWNWSNGTWVCVTGDPTDPPPAPLVAPTGSGTDTDGDGFIDDPTAGGNDQDDEDEDQDQSRDDDENDQDGDDEEEKRPVPRKRIKSRRVADVSPNRRRAAQLVDGVSSEAQAKLRGHLAPVLEKVGQQAAAAVREAVKGGRHVSPTELANTVINGPRWESHLHAIFSQIMTLAAETGGAAEWQLYREWRASKGFKVRVKMPNRFWAVVREVARELSSRGTIRGIIESIRQAVRKACRKGQADNKTGAELADAVNAVLVGPGAERTARVIARNEGAGAVNAGQHAVRQELTKLGKVAGCQWVCIDDNRTRHTHRAADGQLVPPGSPFVVGGYQCKCPGDPALPAKERDGCRCRVITIFK